MIGRYVECQGAVVADSNSRLIGIQILYGSGFVTLRVEPLHLASSVRTIRDPLPVYRL